jgi:type 2 lantibiotic biosynthesis protein LanM
MNAPEGVAVDPDRDLHAIVARATFLSERLRESGSVKADRCQAICEARLERWRRAVGGREDSGWLEKRLRWDGLEVEGVQPLLADGPPKPYRPLPDWALVLRDVSDAARNFDPAAVDHSPLDAQRPVAFEDLLLPGLLVAREMLCARLGLEAQPLPFPLLGMVSADAYRSLERSLLAQLSSLSGQTLGSEFWRSRPYGQALLVGLGFGSLEADGDAYYRRFVRDHLDCGLLDLMRQYPVLGRLMATAVKFWVEGTVEFLERLVADCRDLVDLFDLSDAPLRVTGVEDALSDPHRMGRSVKVVEFACGHKVVYKPKPLGLEAAFSRLLGWCNRRATLPELRVTAVLDRGDYGWVEYLAHLPCVDESAAERFYFRAGMLLCLLYATRATDCHHENLVAHGEQPTLVDAETLLHHEPEPLESPLLVEASASLAKRQPRDSVLRTGLLPRWQVDGDLGVAYDISGLGGVSDQPESREALRWHRINTDDMHASYERATLEAGENAPRLNGRVLSPLDYQGEVASGFEQMYRFLMQHREALLAPDGPLGTMRMATVRCIYRATRIYGALSALSWGPDKLRSGIDYGIHLEQLARVFLGAARKPDAWPVFGAEIRALEQMDIPAFVASADDTALDAGDGSRVPGALRQSSFGAMARLLNTMGEADLARQLAIIQAAFHAKAAQTPAVEVVNAGLAKGASPALRPDELVGEATAIGVELERRALYDGGDGVSWIGPGYMEQADRFQLRQLNDDLYDGRSGVALFLAALGAVTGEERFRTLALRGLDASRRWQHSMDPASRRLAARLSGLGAAVGLGSIIYCLVQTGVLLDEPALIADASTLADWLTPEVIAADENLDVMGGAAGALLSLLSLYTVSGDRRVLAKAVACGDHLLQRRTEWDGGQQAWRTIADRPLTGFSHGAAGIAYALVRLFGATRNSTYLDAAVDGIEFERSVFSERRGNWPDFRSAGTDGRIGFPVKWCHGAAGIALGRLGCREIVDIAGIDGEIETGLGTTREHYLQDVDYLCCGNVGRMETFLVAARVTGRSEWRRLAEAGAAAVVEGARHNGHYTLSVDVPGMYNPGFFQGMAGIGYQLLRLACDELPAVLVWE